MCIQKALANSTTQQMMDALSLSLPATRGCFEPGRYDHGRKGGGRQAIRSDRFVNIAAVREVDREFKYNFGSNLGLFGSGRGSNGRGAPVGFVWAEFQLKRSHGLVLTNDDLVLTDYYLVLTKDHLVLTNDYLVLTNDYMTTWY